METLNISTFKATCLEVLARVRRTGQSVRITRRGEPIAEIIPPQPSREEQPWLGALGDRGEIHGDIVGPTDTSWEALES